MQQLRPCTMPENPMIGLQVFFKPVSLLCWRFENKKKKKKEKKKKEINNKNKLCVTNTSYHVKERI